MYLNEVLERARAWVQQLRAADGVLCGSGQNLEAGWESSSLYAPFGGDGEELTFAAWPIILPSLLK